jgi:MYXO-CTERM domain-containing protein
VRVTRPILVWSLLAAALGIPLVVAAFSPLLAWRGPVYIIAGFAGINALGLLLVQPLLIAGVLPGLEGRPGRRVHLWTGAALIALVVIHVGGLWIVSPPDMLDALTFTSPTPFSPFGVVAMWALFAVGVLVALRRRLSPRVWRRIHMALAAVIVIGVVVHAWLIEGAMETVTKGVLCAVVVAAAIRVMAVRLFR